MWYLPQTRNKRFNVGYEANIANREIFSIVRIADPTSHSACEFTDCRYHPIEGQFNNCELLRRYMFESALFFFNNIAAFVLNIFFLIFCHDA